MKNEEKIIISNITSKEDKITLEENEDLLFGNDDLFLLKKESEKEREVINKVRIRELHIKYRDLGYTDSILRFNPQVNLIKTLIGFLKVSMKEEEVCKILYGILEDKEDLEKQVENILSRK